MRHESPVFFAISGREVHRGVEDGVARSAARARVATGPGERAARPECRMLRWSRAVRSGPGSDVRPARRARPSRLSERAGLQRWDLVVDLRSVVEVVVIPARGREEELDTVATDAVVTREQGRASDGSDLTFRIVAGPHAEDDLHDVPGETPHHRVVRVVDEVVFDRHGDRTGWLISNAVFLTQDPGDGVRFQIDLAVTASEAARFADRGQRWKSGVRQGDARRFQARPARSSAEADTDVQPAPLIRHDPRQ